MSTVVFDFITDEDFRAGLESDFREMEVAAANEAWKAVHVLAGSIIEAVLVDYLVAAGQSKPDPLGMSLAELIAACRKAGVLSQKTADLSAAVKSYRNLIHPGRAKRLKESVDADGSSVAQSLVAIIVREVAAGQQERYGFTAEQIVAKFESDPSALGISQHLLRDAKEREIERLLLKVLPGSYFSTLEEQWPDAAVLQGHARLFRAAVDVASLSVKKKVMARYVTVLKEEPGAVVRVYEEEFFRAPDLEFVENADRDIVKAHLFSGLQDDVSVGLLAAARGIGKWIHKDDVNRFVDPLVRAAVANSDESVRKGAEELLRAEADHTPEEVDPAIIDRLNAWEVTYARQNQPAERAQKVRAIRDTFEYNIPF